VSFLARAFYQSVGIQLTKLGSDENITFYKQATEILSACFSAANQCLLCTPLNSFSYDWLEHKKKWTFHPFAHECKATQQFLKKQKKTHRRMWLILLLRKPDRLLSWLRSPIPVQRTSVFSE
jgi:hypothetical protein